MHIVIVLGLLIALVLWFYWVTDPRPESGARPATPLPARLPSGLALTFIAAGKLFYKNDAGAVRSRTFPGAANSQVSCALMLQDGTALCFLRGERMGRLLSCDLETGRETDLLQHPYLDLSDLSLDERGERILCTSAAADGTSNIASLAIEGGSFRELTAGDTLDAAPTRVPGDAGTLLFQSCGVARNTCGDIVAHGNISIRKLNLRTRSVDAVLESPSYDFLAPRVCAQGKLYFIRRPYEGSHFSTGNLFLDTLLFPLQLLRASIRHLTALAPLLGHTTLAGAAGQASRADAGNVMLKGRRIDAERARHEAAALDGIAALVPHSWELVVRTALGAEQVLATNVASFDLMEDGNIVYSNGCAVYLLERGRSTLLLRDQLVGDVSAARSTVAMGAPAN